MVTGKSNEFLRADHPSSRVFNLGRFSSTNRWARPVPGVDEEEESEEEEEEEEAGQSDFFPLCDS